ncbi:MAG: hypothetical protein AAGA09_02160 [Pseudomonadota bacterium]
MTSGIDRKYDDADWHYGGDFPDDVPIENASVHIGFYLSWAARRELLSAFTKEEAGADLHKVLKRENSPIHLIDLWDGKFLDDMLSDEGNRFSKTYYGSPDATYLRDFTETFEKAGMEIYRIDPSWENYDKIEPVLDRRYQEWRSQAK